eukprot:10415768-Prorocentrum_lima.AAC.1
MCSQCFVEKPDSCPRQEATCGGISPPDKGDGPACAHDKGSIGAKGMQQQQQQQQMKSAAVPA